MDIILWKMIQMAFFEISLNILYVLKEGKFILEVLSFIYKLAKAQILFQHSSSQNNLSHLRGPVPLEEAYSFSTVSVGSLVCLHRQVLLHLILPFWQWATLKVSKESKGPLPRSAGAHILPSSLVIKTAGQVVGDLGFRPTSTERI